MNRDKLFKMSLILNDETQDDFIERINATTPKGVNRSYLNLLIKGRRDHNSTLAQLVISAVDNYIANTIYNNKEQLIKTIEALSHE